MSTVHIAAFLANPHPQRKLLTGNTVLGNCPRAVRRGGSNEPPFQLGSYVIDSYLACLDLCEIAG